MSPAQITSLTDLERPRGNHLSVRRCPHSECAVGVGMTLRETRVISPTFNRRENGVAPSISDGMSTEETWTCDLCSGVVMIASGYISVNGRGLQAAWRRMLWPEPAPRELSTDVPEPIRGLYAEASRAEQAGAPRLAGAGYRATVEEICKQQGATKKTLYEKIDELAPRLGQDVVDALHEARLVGNDSLHDGLAFGADEIADVADLVREVTVLLYDQPAQRQRMAAARQQRRSDFKNATI